MRDEPIQIIVEDEPSRFIAEIILKQCSKPHSEPIVTRGFGKIRNRIHKYNQAAVNGRPMFVLTDLDDSRCPSELIQAWLPDTQIHPRLLFRIAVREIESWILADRASCEKHLGLNLSNVPQSLDSVRDPKRLMVKLARKSRLKWIQKGLVPQEDSTALVGKEYNPIIISFIRDHWNLEIARKHSESLERTCQRVLSF